MQFPNGISKPGKLERPQIGRSCGRECCSRIQSVKQPVGESGFQIVHQMQEASRRTSFSLGHAGIANDDKLRLASLHCLAS